MLHCFIHRILKSCHLIWILFCFAAFRRVYLSFLVFQGALGKRIWLIQLILSLKDYLQSQEISISSPQSIFLQALKQGFWFQLFILRNKRKTMRSKSLFGVLMYSHEKWLTSNSSRPTSLLSVCLIAGRLKS